MTIKELCKEAYENAKNHGFWEDWDLVNWDEKTVKSGDCVFELKDLWRNAIATKLMLIVSEVSEALEALRGGDEGNFKEELADVAIRLGDLCGGLGIDLETEIKKKMDKNKSRSYKHGKAF